MTKHRSGADNRSWTHRSDNRERLIDAGYDLLARKGLGATTVKEIAQVAGVSPGLFHYYFDSKDALLLAIVEEAGRRFKERLDDTAALDGPTGERIAGATRLIAGIARHEPHLFRLRYELYALGLRDQTFLLAVGAQLGQIKSNIAQTLGRWSPEIDATRLEALSAAILACFDGFALQQITQPDADLTSAYDLLRELIESILIL